MSGERRGVGAGLLRGGLTGFECLYAAGLSVYLGAENVGLRRRKRLPVPVISIGNLTVGGTGKTPMTQWLARRLQQAGERPGILNRGHGGSVTPQAALVSAGDGKMLLSATEAGDEAALLAQSLDGVPVAVGKDRRGSGALLLEAANPTILVLDDGLQYWQLYRDIDVVLLDARNPFDNGHALPRGLLREPKTGLRRAGAIVFTRSDQVAPADRDNLRETAGRLAPGTPIFFASHKPGRLIGLSEQARDFVPKYPLLVCGIEQPTSFESAAREFGLSPTSLLAFPDHQPYSDSEKAIIAGNIRSAAADSIIVTSKDAVKLPSNYLDVPIFALEVVISLDDPDGLLETILSRCGIGGAAAARSDKLS